MTYYDPDWGSDTRFRTYRAHAFVYSPIGKSVVLAGRADTRGANGDVPFYLLPFVDLRGVPALRLQDRRTAVIETEARWNVTPRWALVGFAGAARAWGTSTNFSDGTNSRSAGMGFRYLIAQRLGMYVGMDFAWSTQDRAFSTSRSGMHGARNAAVSLTPRGAQNTAQGGRCSKTAHLWRRCFRATCRGTCWLRVRTKVRACALSTALR